MLLTMIFFLSALFIGCSEKVGSNEWLVEEMAGIENPGFEIESKTKTKHSISFVLSDINIEMVNEFLTNLYDHPDFNLDLNYNYETDSYSYAASNQKGESIHFTYNPVDKRGYFIYAKSGDAIFVPGVRDMGYSVRASYDYISSIDDKTYIASLSYGIALQIKFTDSREYLESFMLNNFVIVSPSAVGNLSVRSSAYSPSVENLEITGNSMYNMKFFVFQGQIGSYPTSTLYSSTSEYFNLMGISQSQLSFTISFTAYIQSNKGSYQKDYVIQIMPEGSDVTKMDRYMDASKTAQTIERGIPYHKIG